MSLFDRYFSQKNKDYIFTLLCTTFQDENGHNYKKDHSFIEHYKRIYPQIFEESISDDLISLNKELIDAMDAYRSTKNHNHIPEYNNNANNRSLLNIYSSDRIQKSKNRYDYKIALPLSDKKKRCLEIKKITLPKDPHFPSLFVGTTCKISISDQSQMIESVFEIVHSQTIGDKEYITYHPQINQSLELSGDIIHIKIQDRYGYSCEDNSDIANIILMKSIENRGTCLQVSANLQEPIGLLGKDGYEQTLKIKLAEDSYLLIDDIDSIDKGDSLLEMQSQNHIVCDIIETPNIIQTHDKYNDDLSRLINQTDHPTTDRIGSDGSPSQDPLQPS